MGRCRWKILSRWPYLRCQAGEGPAPPIIEQAEAMVQQIDARLRQEACQVAPAEDVQDFFGFGVFHIAQRCCLITLGHLSKPHLEAHRKVARLHNFWVLCRRLNIVSREMHGTSDWWTVNLPEYEADVRRRTELTEKYAGRSTARWRQARSQELAIVALFSSGTPLTRMTRGSSRLATSLRWSRWRAPRAHSDSAIAHARLGASCLGTTHRCSELGGARRGRAPCAGSLAVTGNSLKPSSSEAIVLFLDNASSPSA